MVGNFRKRRYAAAGATRHARLLKIEPPCGEKNGFEPHFAAILDFFGPRKKAHVSTHSTLAVVQDSICAVVSPSRAIQTGEKKFRQETAGSGGWGCRMTRLFSHEAGL